MYKSTKTFGHDRGLSCCFRQWRAKSHCNLLHGYALSVHLEFSALTLDERNWVVDFGALKQIEQWLKATFDHTLLIAKDDPLYENLWRLQDLQMAKVIELDKVGCEAFAELIAEYVQEWLKEEYSPSGRVWLSKVEVKEHGANGAIFEPVNPLSVTLDSTAN